MVLGKSRSIAIPENRLAAEERKKQRLTKEKIIELKRQVTAEGELGQRHNYALNVLFESREFFFRRNTFISFLRNCTNGFARTFENTTQERKRVFAFTSYIMAHGYLTILKSVQRPSSLAISRYSTVLKVHLTMMFVCFVQVRK